MTTQSSCDHVAVLSFFIWIPTIEDRVAWRTTTKGKTCSRVSLVVVQVTWWMPRKKRNQPQNSHATLFHDENPRMHCILFRRCKKIPTNNLCRVGSAQNTLCLCNSDKCNRRRQAMMVSAVPLLVVVLLGRITTCSIISYQSIVRRRGLSRVYH